MKAVCVGISYGMIELIALRWFDQAIELSVSGNVVVTRRPPPAFKTTTTTNDEEEEEEGKKRRTSYVFRSSRNERKTGVKTPTTRVVRRYCHFSKYTTEKRYFPFCFRFFFDFVVDRVAFISVCKLSHDFFFCFLFLFIERSNPCIGC